MVIMRSIKLRMFIAFSILIVTTLILRIRSNATIEKIDTDWAIDVFNKPLDNGIGRFICKSTDLDSPIKDNITSSYYVFEYLRNDAKNPLSNKYVLISKYNVPEFVYNGLENTELIFGIYDGYWTPTEIGYYSKQIEYNCALDLGVILGHDMNDTDFTVLAYFEFLNVDIEEIYEIEFNFKIWRLKRYGLFWSKKRSVFKSVNAFVKADEVRVNEKEYTGDYRPGDNIPLFLLKNKWLFQPIEKLNEPKIIDGKNYLYKVNTGYRIKDNRYYTYLADPLDKSYVPEGISYMKFQSKGVIYATENLKMISFDTNLKYKESFFDKIFNFASSTISNIGSILLVLLSLLIIIAFYKIIKNNKQNNKKKE